MRLRARARQQVRIEALDLVVELAARASAVGHGGTGARQRR